MAKQSFVLCDGLVKIYKVADLEVVALHGLDLEVAQGEMMALVGPSGSGKSTLLNVIGGLDVPSAGGVWVDDQDLLKMGNKERSAYKRQSVGFVWQQPGRNLFSYLSAQENVELPMILNGIARDKRRKRSLELLDMVGLADRVCFRPDRLSGGEQQRVALCVALANNPPLLLTDELTGQLDNESASQIFDALHTINGAYRTTIIIVTHDPEVAKRVDRVVAIRDGRTSTEIRRRRNQKDQNVQEEEWLILDQTGRLQLPAAYIETLGLEGRVKARLEPDHVTVWPKDGRRRAEVADRLTQQSSAPSGEPAAGVSTEEQEWKHLVRLHTILTTCLNKGELLLLCTHLGVAYDALPGATKADKAGKLIVHLGRHNRIPELVKVGLRMRPDIAWDGTPQVAVQRPRVNMPAGKGTAVSIKGLSRTFEVGVEKIHAVQNVDLEIPATSMVAIKGRSGSGKTTLLNLIAGLDEPTSGTITLDGQPLNGMSFREKIELRRRGIGFVYQTFGLLHFLSVQENIEVPLRLMRMPRQERQARIADMLEVVGLADRAYHRTYELSGGEQQRVSIARALVNRPSLLLADEPTGQLDTVTGSEIIALLREIATQAGVTVVIASHDPTVHKAADLVFELQDGRLA
jgi:ABC-type lipoprotein export system ATPase subunit